MSRQMSVFLAVTTHLEGLRMTFSNPADLAAAAQIGAGGLHLAHPPEEARI